MRALAALLVVLLALFAGTAHAQESEIQTGIRDAERLLGALEYQRAREILERLASDRGFGDARRSTRAKLLVTLGRARAELGDEPGMSEAFEEAVGIDPTVTLPRGTSPKILAALERARDNAPITASKGPPKASPSPKPPDPPKIEPPKPTRTATVARPKAVRSSTASTVRPSDGSPRLSVRIVGRVEERARIRIVVEAEGVPRTAKIEARIRAEGSRVFEPYLMPWAAGTSTQAALALTLDAPKYELYVEAKVGKKTVARAGSPAEPIVIEPGEVQSLAEAWAAPELEVKTTTTSTTIAAAQVIEEGLGTTPWIIGGATVGAALIVILIVVAASSGGGSDCAANEGFGCTDVSIRPLFRF